MDEKIWTCEYGKYIMSASSIYININKFVTSIRSCDAS